MQNIFILLKRLVFTAERDFRYAKFKCPFLDIPSLRLATETSPLVTLENCVISYQQKEKRVLEKVTLQLTLKSCVGIIGRNGKGKSLSLSVCLS
jgi:ABC-type transport system involved in cytochrome bd biosynthesis fused ATPase/permease subunit